jgi:16S rRNA (uracil1498-N3)-methyltransferase
MMDYFYAPPQSISAESLTIEGDEFSHLTHVMRKKVGDIIRVVNGAGTAFEVTITEISKHVARCLISGKIHQLNEPSIDVTAGVAILKNASKFDFIVEKLTELGVNTIVPISTGRTIPRHAKSDRWRKLALAAMKQSCRCVLPTVRDLTSFSQYINSAPPESLRILPHEKTESPSLANIARGKQFQSAMLCIGPEGGFTDEEVALAQRNGFVPASLGPRRLRTETAAIVAAGILLSGK